MLLDFLKSIAIVIWLSTIYSNTFLSWETEQYQVCCNLTLLSVVYTDQSKRRVTLRVYVLEGFNNSYIDINNYRKTETAQ